MPVRRNTYEGARKMQQLSECRAKRQSVHEQAGEQMDHRMKESLTTVRAMFHKTSHTLTSINSIKSRPRKVYMHVHNRNWYTYDSRPIYLLG